MEWISVKDKLPDTEGEYPCRLIGDDGEVFHECAWYTGVDFNYVLDQIFAGEYQTTHWCHLPDPPL